MHGYLFSADRRALIADSSIRLTTPCQRKPLIHSENTRQFTPCNQLYKKKVGITNEPFGILRNSRRRAPPPTAVAAQPATTTVFFSQGWPLWTCLAICAAMSQVIEKRTKAGVFLSAPLVATLISVFLASCGLIPSASPVYDTIWTYIMPLSAAMYLLESDISKLVTSAGQSTLAFVNGAVGSILGTLISFAVVGQYLGPDGPKIAAALCASYIGGSVNFAAVSGLFGLTTTSGTLLASAMTADNLAMAAYIAILMSIPAHFTSNNSVTTASKDEMLEINTAVTAETLGLSLAAASLSCALGTTMAQKAGFSSGGLAFTALVASSIPAIVGFFVRRRLQSSSTSPSNSPVFSGSEALGGALMLFFFATIGAAAGSFSALRHSGWILIFIAIQLTIQLSFALTMGKVMRIPMPTILIAANANVGGPATAAAMAASKGWLSLISPAILTGALGYAVANGIGWAIGLWLMTW